MDTFIKKSAIILSLVFYVLLTGLFSGCNKKQAEIKNSATMQSKRKPDTFGNTGPNFFGTTSDSLTFRSIIHTSGATCSLGDSTRTITVVRKSNGNVYYHYSTGKALSHDKYESYTDDSLVQVSTTEVTTTLTTTDTYFIIYFDNPRNPSEIEPGGGTITFSCECCSGGGQCSVTGSCCPFTVDCATTNCSGGCGLNAHSSLIPSVDRISPLS